MENQSEKLDHQVAGLPSLCLASSRIQFSVHTRVYFFDQEQRPPSLEAQDTETAGRLWEISERQCAVRSSARHKQADYYRVSLSLLPNSWADATVVRGPRQVGHN